VKFKEQIQPDTDLIQYKLEIKRVVRRKLILGIADGSVECGGHCLYKCEDLKVGLFK
jgi:3-hydroxyacyl-[acyl-carrier protein] dehydratase / trans-2-decenoyl-[acyl-carrier protein] isomerase